MSLVVYWYDFVCFGILGGAVFGSLLVIWRKEGSGKRCDDNTMYESLLIGCSPDSNGFVNANISNSWTGHLSSSQLWTTCWRGVHPIWLLALRFIALATMAGFLTWDVVDWDTSIFVYYTEWTFALVIIYFALGTIISAYGCWEYSKRPPSENGENGERGEFLKEDLEDNSRSVAAVTLRAKDYRGAIKLQSHYVEEAIMHRAGFWGYLMQTLYQTCAGAVILTDIVFWCVIVPFLSNSHLGLNVLMGCMHSLNVFFLLLDTSLNSLPFPWFRLSYFVLWSSLYVIFQWVIHACGFTWWPYPFLELSTSWAPLWYFCLALLHIPCYGLFALLMKAKVSIFSRLFPRAFVRSY